MAAFCILRTLDIRRFVGCFILCCVGLWFIETVDGNGEGIPLSLTCLRFDGFKLCVFSLCFFLRSSLLTTDG